MKKVLQKIIAMVAIVSCICVNAVAAKFDVTNDNFASDDSWVEITSVSRATGSFNVSVAANARAKGDTDFPLEAGETVRIYATYSPESASVDFGLVDPDGVFHYVSAENGSVDTTFEIPESGNYRLGIKNNSGQTVKVSGFVKY